MAAKKNPKKGSAKKRQSPKKGPAKQKPEPTVNLGKKAMAALARPVDDVAALADRWRSAFMGALHATTNPEKIYKFLEEGRKGRYWLQLADAEGKTFRTFEGFCEAPTPYGLATPTAEVKRFLYEHLSPAAARRVTLRSQARGARNDLLPNAKQLRAATRTDQRDWAIERAPEIVRWFKDATLLSADVAAHCGPLKPSAPKLKAIAGVEAYLNNIVFEAGENFDATTPDEGLDMVGRKKLLEFDPASRRMILNELSPTISRMLTGETVEPSETPVYSAYRGYNSTVFKEILRLHVPRGSTVADVTYNTGRFWQEVEDGAYEVLKSDLMLGSDDTGAEVRRYDFRALPYESASLDALVLDPPYSLSPRNTWIDEYGVDTAAELEGRKRYPDLLDEYEDGAKAALRVLKPGGRVIVKCQDTASQGGGLKLTHVDLLSRFRTVGFEFLDMFVLVTPSTLAFRAVNQRIARRRHSFFLVWVKPDAMGRS